MEGRGKGVGEGRRRLGGRGTRPTSVWVGQPACVTRSKPRRRFGKATLRLSLRAGFLGKREKWRTPSLFRSKFKNRGTSHVNGAHPPGRYSPAPMIETIIKVRDGRPDLRHVSTSFIERQNLTMRMAIRRFTRLTNAFSKKLDNLKAACALHFAYYNFCRTHQSLRVSPAVEAGLTDHIWTSRELLPSA